MSINVWYSAIFLTVSILKTLLSRGIKFTPTWNCKARSKCYFAPILWHSFSLSLIFQTSILFYPKSTKNVTTKISVHLSVKFRSSCPLESKSRKNYNSILNSCLPKSFFQIPNDADSATSNNIPAIHGYLCRNSFMGWSRVGTVLRKLWPVGSPHGTSWGRTASRGTEPHG